MCSVKSFQKYSRFQAFSVIIWTNFQYIFKEFNYSNLLNVLELFVHIASWYLWQAGIHICSFCSFVCLHFLVILSSLGFLWHYVSHDIVCYVLQLLLSVYMCSICLNCIQLFLWVSISLICINIFLKVYQASLI